MALSRRIVFACVLAAFACGIAIACGSGDDGAGGGSGSDASSPLDGGAANDATGAVDGLARDGAGGGQDGAAGDGGGAFDGATFHDVGDASTWQGFDIGTIGVHQCYEGGAFDGRYVYFIPYQSCIFQDGGLTAGGESGTVVRFDSTMPFENAASWDSFDLTTLSPTAGGFFNGVFDGRYVYFSSGPIGHVTARYDTTMGFKSAAAWTFAQRPDSYVGAAFDGKAIYMPGRFAGEPIARHDLTQPLDAGWTNFDPRTLNGDAGGGGGAFFDGRYTYFVPFAASGNQPDGIATRFDTQGSFADAASWEAFDLYPVDKLARGFAGAVFDGRYAYYVPYYNGVSPDGVVARYDTQGPFGIATSWTTFDVLNKVSPYLNGFYSGVFDGRYVYMLPGYGDALGRYDTSAPFADPASWTLFRTTTVNKLALQFTGGAFDGRYLYLIPGPYSIAVRFDAKTPPSIPASYHGSFL